MTEFLEYLYFDSVHHQFGLVQDVPPTPLHFFREEELLVEVIQHLIYAELDLTQEEVLVEDTSAKDIGMIKAFDAWWQVEVKVEDRDVAEHQVCQQVAKPKATTKVEEERVEERVKEQVMANLEDTAGRA